MQSSVQFSELIVGLLLLQECGIPKHFGLFYAMGTALMMEGLLSACYHVCPNYTNFQFGKAACFPAGTSCPSYCFLSPDRSLDCMMLSVRSLTWCNIRFASGFSGSVFELVWSDVAWRESDAIRLFSQSPLTVEIFSVLTEVSFRGRPASMMMKWKIFI